MTPINYKPKRRVLGYHGTNAAFAQSIITNNFFESKNDTWYGNAVYFFVEGISADKPETCAANWAIDNAWDSNLKQHSYTEYSVMEAEIKLDDDKFLDLTEIKGSQLFNEYRRMYQERLLANNKTVFDKIIDADILSHMRKTLGIEFVKGNVYIKFGMQRKNRIHSRIPNVTIFAVNNSSKNIKKPTIREHLKGEIL